MSTHILRRSCVECGRSESIDMDTTHERWATCRWCFREICPDCDLSHDCKADLVEAAQARCEAAYAAQTNGPSDPEALR